MIEPPAAKLYRVEDLPLDRPMPTVERRLLVGQRAMIAEVRFEKGTIIDRHQHPNEQFALIRKGSIRFFFGDEGDSRSTEVVAGPGDLVHLPGGVVHGAEILEEARVLDIFAPPSESTGIDRKEAGD